MNLIINQLNKSSRVLIVSHKDPDGDAIGALLATGLAMEKLGKQTVMFNESPIPAVYRFLPMVNRIRHTLGESQKFDTAIVLDCGGMGRIGNAASLVEEIPVVINIDHHTTNTRFGDLQAIDTEACATAEIVYRLLTKMNVAIDKAIASGIYTGILTDTGSFRFSNTNRAAFTICDEMVGIGVSPSIVAQHVYGTYSIGRIKLLNLALDSIEISRNGLLSIMTVTKQMFQETGTHHEDADGLINYARRIRDVKVAALIHELENSGDNAKAAQRFHVSLRSDEGVDVARIASEFGGGGHAAAAGFSIDATLPELKKKIISLSEKLSNLCVLN